MISALLAALPIASAEAQEPKAAASAAPNLVLFRAAASLGDEKRWSSVEIAGSEASGTRRRLHFEVAAVTAALRAHPGGTGAHAAALAYPEGALFVAEDLDADGGAVRTEVLEIGARGEPRFQVYDAGGAAQRFDAASCTACHVSARTFEPWRSFPREREELKVGVDLGARHATAAARFGEGGRRGAPVIASYGALHLGALDDRARRGALRADELDAYHELRERAPELLVIDPAYPAAAQPELDTRVGALLAAFERHLANPTDEEALIWTGRRLAYLGRFDEAIRLYSQGLADHPASAKLLRHRGHRQISTRRYELAAADLERARELAFAAPDEVEPDGVPNAEGVALTTLRSNVLYHLALAHYLRGDWLRARDLWSQDLAMASNDDRRCSAGVWLWSAAKRCGDDACAQRALDAIGADTRVIENHAYLDVLRHRRNELASEELLARHAASTALASAGYGLAETLRAQGQRAEARELLERIVAKAPPSAFGTLAAEAELARLRAAERR